MASNVFYKCLPYVVCALTIILFVSCHKNNPPKISKDKADYLAGSYIGNVMKAIYREYDSVGMHHIVHNDTSYYQDTIIIDRISADSFRLINNEYLTGVTGMYHCNDSNKYLEYWVGTGDGFTLTLDFRTATDSLYLSSYFTIAPGGSISRTVDKFYGKKLE